MASIAAFIPAILGGANAIFGGGSGSSGGGSNTSALSSFLAGQLGTQRIPGQTTSGEYTPPAGGFGTYNYIPTGATQIDPQLISTILSSMGQNSAAGNTATSANGDLLGGQLNNPLNSSLTTGADWASQISGNAADYNTNAAAGLSGSSSYLDSSLQNVINAAAANPGTQNYVQGAGQVGAGQVAAGGSLSSQLMPYLSSALQNPYNSQALAGSQQAGSMLQGAGQNAYGQGATYSGTAAAGLPAASQILNTAFDPQTTLYNQTAGQLNDQLGAYLASTGLTNSGAGAKIASDALTNFNTNWQNNQLGRETQGLNSFTQALSPIGGALTSGNTLQGTGAGQVASGSALPSQTYNSQIASALGLAQTGAGAYGAASGLQEGGYQLPYTASNQTTQDFSQYVNNYANALPGMTNAATAGSNLMNAGATAAYNSGALPYQAGQTIYGNQNTALSNYLGNASGVSGLNNTNISQMLSYLSAVNAGANTAGRNAQGAQTQQTGQNTAAVAGLSPSIQALLSMISGSGGSTSNLFASGGFTPYTGDALTPFTPFTD